MMVEPQRAPGFIYLGTLVHIVECLTKPKQDRLEIFMSMIDTGVRYESPWPNMASNQPVARLITV